MATDHALTAIRRDKRQARARRKRRRAARRRGLVPLVSAALHRGYLVEAATLGPEPEAPLAKTHELCHTDCMTLAERTA